MDRKVTNANIDTESIPKLGAFARWGPKPSSFKIPFRVTRRPVVNGSLAADKNLAALQTKVMASQEQSGTVK